jgi:signal transduction histidine kinase
MNYSPKIELGGIGLSLEQEKLVIRRYVLYSIAITVFYALLTLRNIILKPQPEDTISLIITGVIIAIFSLYFAIRNHFIAKNYITIIFSITAVFAFFSFNGITGLFVIDYINVVIFTSILFANRILIRYGIYYFIMITVLIFVQFNDLIPMRQDIIYFNPKTDSIIFIFTRLVLTVNMILYLKSRHNVERANLLRKNKAFIELTKRLEGTNEELITQNKQVSHQKKLIDNQNKELKVIQAELVQANNTLEDRIAIRTEDLVRVNQKLQSTLTKLDRFVYSASHDLSAPLKSLLGLVHIARLENPDERLLEHFNHIEKSINKQEEVIRDLIQFSRNNRSTIHRSEINLNNLIHEITTELRFYPGFSDVQLTYNLEKSEIVSDKSRIQMILSNILSNAIKYRDPEKEQSRIIVTSRETNSGWELEIEDNGLGIEPDQQEKIFDMFYRANEDIEGTGLGLFIVTEAVEKLYGTISLESRVGEGSKFKVVFDHSADVTDNAITTENDHQSGTKDFAQ